MRVHSSRKGVKVSQTAGLSEKKIFQSEHLSFSLNLLFNCLFISNNIATGHEEKYAAKCEQGHREVDPVLILVVLDKLRTVLHGVRISFGHLWFDGIHQSTNLKSGN